jgi:hypothetical protein
VFHGLLGDTTSAELRGLTTKQKVPFVDPHPGSGEPHGPRWPPR